MSTAINSIPGLDYIPYYLSLEAQHDLLVIIDQQPWLTDLKRRVQHYGYRYDYTRRSTNDSLFVGPLPSWAATLAERLTNEGISSHVDCVPCFGDTVLSISIGSPCVMLFSHIQTKQQVPILLEVGSLVVMRGESRYQWKHGIPARKTDTYEGQKIIRERRISLTFRTIIPNHPIAV